MKGGAIGGKMSRRQRPKGATALTGLCGESVGAALTNRQAFGPFEDAKLKKLHARLRSLRYTEEGVSKRLGIWHITAITLPQYPVYHERLRRRFDALSAVISLFLLQGELARETAGEALGRDIVTNLLTLGLLTGAGDDTVASAVSIYPCSGFYFVTDHQFRPEPHDHHGAPKQPVMHLGQDSYALAYLAPSPPKGGRVLDLCSGSGVHAITASRRAKRVVGVDINPRAVEFARLNAAFNGVNAKCHFREGSLYEAAHQDPAEHDSERFDLILANPPFLPSPPTGTDHVLFKDGGPAGDEILRPVLMGLLRHMKPRGSAVIISMFADQRGARAESKIKRWIGARAQVDLSLLKIYSLEPEELASVLAWRLFGDDFADYSRRYKEWLDVLRSQRIVRLTFGVLFVRLGRSGFRAIDVPLSHALNKGGAAELSRLIRGLDQSTEGR